MVSKTRPTQLLSRLETRIAELEQVVQSFEQVAAEAEKLIDEVEQSEGAHDSSSQSAHLALGHTLHTGSHTAQHVRTASTDLDQLLTLAEQAVVVSLLDSHCAPLPDDTLIIQGKYRLIQLLHTRPRIHLYLAQRLSNSPNGQTSEQSLVVIREIVLDGLAPELRQRIEQAAFAEFAAPANLGSSNLPGVGDRLQVEHDRHYLIMQLGRTRGKRPVLATTLAEFLSTRDQKPDQLEMVLALHWGIQLCLIMARLHQMKIVLGELTPAMIVVAHTGYADWAPLLLPCWPPAPCFWTSNLQPEVQELYNLTFPAIPQNRTRHENNQNAFIAPETLVGYRDERSDVYALGALLYLLLTHHTPAPASQRLRAEPIQFTGAGQALAIRASFKDRLLRLLPPFPGSRKKFALMPPHLLNERISPPQEQILLRALALNPEQRFASALDMAKALEDSKLKTEKSTSEPVATPPAQVKPKRKFLKWFKKEQKE